MLDSRTIKVHGKLTSSARKCFLVMMASVVITVFLPISNAGSAMVDREGE